MENIQGRCERTRELKRSMGRIPIDRFLLREYLSRTYIAPGTPGETDRVREVRRPVKPSPGMPGAM